MEHSSVGPYRRLALQSGRLLIGNHKSAREAESQDYPGGIPFEPDPIVHRVAEPLFASEVSLGRLHGDVSQ